MSNIKYTIKDIQLFAKSRGGKCLSKKYVNGISKLKWKCKFGHIWMARLSNVKHGTWCPICAIEERAKKQRFTIEDMQKIAMSRGGECLSKEYVNGISKLKWKCKNGHIWNAVPISINSGAWCSVCAGNYKSNLNEMIKLAAEKGGKCLSIEYINNHTKLKWQCSEGHIWEAQPANLKSGTWCPYCSSGIGEKITRIYFETLFNEKFPRIKPKWLRNKNGNLMELDGYNKKLKLAFEHQGEQHYKYNKFFHKKNELIKRIEDDNRKESLCSKEGITLIRIPEIPSQLKFEDIKNYILKELEKNNYEINIDKISDISFELKNAYISNSSIELFEIKQIAINKKGKCLSKSYLGAKVPLEFICESKHKWNASPGSIKAGSWCPICAGNTKSSLADMFKLAKANNGECLSNQYINNSTKLRWKCNKGHIWESVPASIKSGTWCPICADQNSGYTQKKNINDMIELAKSKSGKCLSKKYINTHTKLKWKCKNGHIWEATPASINYASWCPKCADKKSGSSQKLSIDLMNNLAQEKNGKCLSKKYINSRTKLLWQCKEGHKWVAIPDSIIAGTWCPECAGLTKLTIKDMKKLANEKGGICLSDKYINNRTKLKWQCSKGHIWETAPVTIKSKGRWCPMCGREKTIKARKDTIENMKKIASENNGECLSKVYINNITKLKWICKNKHEWEDTPKNIKKGIWCKECKKENNIAPSLAQDF